MSLTTPKEYAKLWKNERHISLIEAFRNCQNETLEEAAETVEAIDLKYLTRAKAAEEIRALKGA